MPTDIGGYRILTRLDSGAMTETYEAVKDGPGGTERRVRLQWLFPSYAQDPKVRELVVEEARLAMSLRHRCILPVVDFGEHDGSLYLAFESVQGLSLAELIAKHHQAGNCIPVPLVIQIGTDVAEALSHAHATHEQRPDPAYHGDISPERILLSDAGEVLLTGFGLGGALQKSETTRSHFVRANAWYMSPEQVSEKPVDGRSDIYSLGCVLFELLAGRRAFDAGSDLEAMVKVSKGDRPALADVAKQVSEPVLKLVESMMERRPEHRPVTVADVHQGLSSVAVPAGARRELAEFVALTMGVDGPALSSPSLPSPVEAEPAPAGTPPSPEFTGSRDQASPLPVGPRPPSEPQTDQVPTRPQLDLAAHEPATEEMAPFEPATEEMSPHRAPAGGVMPEPLEAPTQAFTPLADQMAPSSALVGQLGGERPDIEPPTAAFVPERERVPGAPPAPLYGAPPPPGWGRGSETTPPVGGTMPYGRPEDSASMASLYGGPPPEARELMARTYAAPVAKSQSGLKVLFALLVVLTLALVATLVTIRGCSGGEPPPPPGPSSSEVGRDRLPFS